jgi:hypothetical protein
MAAVGAGVEGCFGGGRVVAPRYAVIAVAQPRLAAVVAKSASELTSVTGAGLVGAGHGSSTIQIEPPSL